MKINVFKAIKSFLKKREDYIEVIDAYKTTIQQGDIRYTDEYATRIYNENKEKLRRLNETILHNAEKLSGYILYYEDQHLQDIVESLEKELDNCEYGSLYWHNIRGKLEGLSILQKCIIKE